MITLSRCFCFFLLALLTACGSEPPPTIPLPPVAQAPAAPPTASADVPEPPFVQEGVLEFRNPGETKSLLRLHIEIAASPGERKQGLMWRKKMAENQGMLFVFDFQEPQSFWMHNTYIPLDIIYADALFKVVSIRKNTPVRSDAPQPSDAPAQYVIEVNAGVADRYGIAPGTQVAWSDFTTGQAMGGFAVPAL